MTSSLIDHHFAQRHAEERSSDASARFAARLDEHVPADHRPPTGDVQASSAGVTVFRRAAAVDQSQSAARPVGRRAADARRPRQPVLLRRRLPSESRRRLDAAVFDVDDQTVEIVRVVAATACRTRQRPVAWNCMV